MIAPEAFDADGAQRNGPTCSIAPKFDAIAGYQSIEDDRLRLQFKNLPKAFCNSRNMLKGRLDDAFGLVGLHSRMRWTDPGRLEETQLRSWKSVLPE